MHLSMNRLTPWQRVFLCFSLMSNQLKKGEHITMEKSCTDLKDHNKEAYIATCMHS